MGGQGLEIFSLVGVDSERQDESLGCLRWQVHELAQRMRLLAVKDAFVLNRSIAAPVRDSSEAFIMEAVAARAVLQQDRLEGRDPLHTASGARAFGPAPRIPYGSETSAGW